MEKQQIKENYLKLLKKNSWLWDDKVLNTPVRKHQCNLVFEELMDTSRKSIGRLTEKQTEMVRKYIGVYGEETYDTARYADFHKLSTCISNMISRIRNGYVVVKDALLSGKLTQEQLLKLKLIKMDYPVIESRHVWALHQNGYTTVEKFLDSPKRVYSGYPVLVDYMHSLGLNFKDEKFSEINNAIDSSNENIYIANKNIYYEKENILNDKYESIKDLNIKTSIADEIAYKAEQLRKRIEELDSYEDRCDEIIEEQMNLKQQIQELRQVALLGISVLGQGKVKTNIKK